MAHLYALTEEEYSAEIFTGFNGFKSSVLHFFEAAQNKSRILTLGGSAKRDKKIDIVWQRMIMISKKKKLLTEIGGFVKSRS